jgi:hypothetical protein
VSNVPRFTPAASFWASFRYLSSAIYGVTYAVALPMQMLMHLRLGQRYLNGVMFTVSMLILMPVVMASLVLSDAWWHILQKTLGGYDTVPRVDRWGTPLLAIGLSVMVPVAYIFHRCHAWWRERGGNIVHSRSYGVPIALIPDRPSDKSGKIAPATPAGAPPAHLFQELYREWKGGWTKMWADVHAGKVPQGWVPWVATTILEPLALFVAGTWIVMVGIPIGAYFMAAAVAMFVQSRIIAAFHREQVLDHRDGAIEQEAWSRVIDGQQAATEEKGYAVPIAGRMLTPEVRQSLATELVDIDPRLAHLLKPARRIKEGPNEAGEAEGPLPGVA